MTAGMVNQQQTYMPKLTTEQLLELLLLEIQGLRRTVETTAANTKQLAEQLDRVSSGGNAITVESAT